MTEYEKQVVKNLRQSARRSGVWNPGREDMQVAADLIEELAAERDALIEKVGQLKKERNV